VVAKFKRDAVSQHNCAGTDCGKVAKAFNLAVLDSLPVDWAEAAGGIVNPAQGISSFIRCIHGQWLIAFPQQDKPERVIDVSVR
jgi:hypothetical protein